MPFFIPCVSTGLNSWVNSSMEMATSSDPFLLHCSPKMMIKLFGGLSEKEKKKKKREDFFPEVQNM